ncbi:MAG: glycosyltransferase [Deltaproteobacteria bacterium]|nr:MAG: glycosyltransferase [Deltaproteobacteria bacterium]
MRIALLVNEFPAASETFVLDHVCALIERGHRVDVFPERPYAPPAVIHPELAAYACLDRSHFPPPMPSARVARALAGARLVFSSGAVHAASMFRSVNPLAYGRQGPSLALLFRQVPFHGSEPYDVVHCHHGPVGVVGANLLRLGVLRGRLVVTFHGFDANVVPRIGGADVYTRLFRKADLITVNSEFLRGRLRALGAPEDRLARLPMGVDPAAFAPASTLRAADPGRSTGDEIRLLSVARLVEEKGIAFALRAVARLAPRFPGLRYQVIGEGPLRGSLERLARQLGISDRVVWLGALPRDRVRAYYADAHLFALPGVRARNGAEESQGLALIEAQASGLAVVASDVGGIPESLRNGRTGFLVPERDVEALAERIAALIRRPGLRAAMGRAGRAFARRHFDRNVLVDRLVSLYEEVVGRPPAAPPRVSRRRQPVAWKPPVGRLPSGSDATGKLR